jgi:two-component system cell cycle response regulator DivK
MTQRILVAEDQDDNRRILADLLGSAGYALSFAVTGTEAVERARAERPNLILMDIQLPLMDGYQATAAIKSDLALRAIPIIAVTSYALSGDEARARLAGCDDYIAKPYRPRALLALVRRHLGEPGAG